jgi:hypothetical protein
MNAAALLDELDPLTHRGRLRRMVDLGRRAAADPGAAAVIEGLAAHPNAYARLLAVATCYGSRDGERALAALGDPSRLVRGRARELIPIVADDAQAARALELVHGRRERTRLTVALRKRRRFAVVDAFLDARFAGGPDPLAADLLALGSAEAAARHAIAFREAASPLAWERLARFRPQAAAAELTARLAAIAPGAPVDPRLRFHLARALPEVCRRAADVGVDLVQRLFARGLDSADGLLRAPLAVLARRLPREVFDLLRARREIGRPAVAPGVFAVRFHHQAHRLGGERLAYLAEHAPSQLPDGDRGRRFFLRLGAEDRAALLAAFARAGQGPWGAFLFRYLAPGRDRELAFRRWAAAARSGAGEIAPHVLRDLPADLRVREARRHLDALPDLATKPEVRLPYASLLPFPEARAALAPWLGHPEGEERARAARFLVDSVRFDRAHLGEALAYAHARKFEQDPVRLAIFGALADLPRRVFTAEALPAVGAVIQDALDAADLSGGTASFVEGLVVRLFRLDAAWGARWLTKLLEARGTISQGGLGDGLTEPEVRALSPVLAELVAAWSRSERVPETLWLAQSFALRLAAVPSILDALEDIAARQPHAWQVTRALELLAKRARPRFVALVPRLLGEDRSVAIVPRVAGWVSRARQDLLDPLLGAARMTGRFATGETGWIIEFGGGHARWNLRQHVTHAAALAAFASDPKRDVPVLRSTVEGLAQLAFAPPDASIALASDPRPPVREMGVRALPWLDAGEGKPVLLECLGDDRARWAIYALRALFREMDAPEVRALLASAPMNKVTVAKEVLRLLGELGGPEAFRDLVALDAPGLHRDVRIALLRALWDHLDREETWAVFAHAAADPDWVLASRLADVPFDRLSSVAEARLARLLAGVLARPEVDARFVLLARVAYLPLRDGERAVFHACLDRLRSPHLDEAEVALGAALARMLPDEAELVAVRLADRLPDRRASQALAAALGRRLGSQPPHHHVVVARRLLDALGEDRLAVVPYLALAPRVLIWSELAAALESLAARGLLHADALVAAFAAVQASTHPDLLDERLGKSPDERLRRVGLAALAHAAGPGRGWSAARRERLARYQADPAALVAGAAAYVFPPPRKEEGD